MRPSKEQLAGCLKECGVRPQAREEILACAQEGGLGSQLCLLGRQRAQLLDDLHRAQRRIDLMDLLIHTLEEDRKTDEERIQMKKVLIISTSLRGKSNSEQLARQFAKGAQDAGNDVELVSLRGKEVRFCTGCMACLKSPRCAQRDDASGIVEKMGQADVLCFATPVYYYEMAGQMKTLLDRANPLFSADYAFRDVYLLTASADRADSASDGTVNGLQGWVSCFDRARLAGVVRGGGANDPGDMEKLTEKLQEAYDMGKNV